MKKLLKVFASLLAVLVLAAAGLLAVAWWKTDQGLARTYVVNDPPLTVLRDAETLAHGKHLFVTKGCSDCHGADGAGKLVFDGGPVLRLVAPNITPGGMAMHGMGGGHADADHMGAEAMGHGEDGHMAGSHTPDQIAAMIRHGVKPDGHPMVFMPTPDFHDLSDTDTAALVAYIQSLPPSSNDPGRYEIRPLGKVLYLLGKFPLLPAEVINHAPRSRTAPPAAVTAEYGQYLAQGCTGCHGADFAGQHVPGTPPEFPDSANLTAHANGLASWSQDDFIRTLRTGKRPDGRKLADFMPWPAIGQMSDVELAAIWTFLRTVPPQPGKK